MKTCIKRSLPFVVSLALAACSAPAKDLVEADLVLLNARVVTGTGAIVDPGMVVVSEGRIQDVTSTAVDIEADVVLDLAGTRYTVLPGLVDAHVHVIPAAPVTSDDALAAYMDKSLPARLDSFLATGTTTVYDNGDFWPAIGDVRNRIASGELRGPRIFTAGPLLTPPNGHPGSTICAKNPYCREHRVIELDVPERARETVDRLAADGVDGIKVVHEHLGLTMDRAVLDAIIERAGANGLPVLSHNQTLESAIEVVEAGVARLVHPPRFGLAKGTPFVDRVVARGVVVASTIGSVGPGTATFEEDPTEYETLKSNAQALRAAGVIVSFGTDNYAGPPKDHVRAEIAAFEDMGLTSEEIVATMTRDSARYIGHGDELGTIEPGKRADLVIVDGDPLEEPSAIEKVVMVLRDGVVVVDNR